MDIILLILCVVLLFLNVAYKFIIHDLRRRIEKLEDMHAEQHTDINGDYWVYTGGDHPNIGNNDQ